MGKRGRPKGTKLSEETKLKIAEARKGINHTEETRLKISNTLKEYFTTPKGIQAREKARELGKQRMQRKKVKEE